MVNKTKIKESVDANCKFYGFFLEPVVDQIMDMVDVSSLPSDDGDNTEDEKKLRYRESISNVIYDKQGLYRVQEGFDLIIENIPRISGGQLVKKELVELGLKMLNDVIKAAEGNEELIVKNMVDIREAMQKDMLNQKEQTKAQSNTSNNELANIISLKSEWGISDQAYGIMYEIACLLFNEQHIDEATSVFYFLSILDVTCHEVWFSLGLCYQRKEDFSEAIANYTLSIITNPNNIYGYVKSANCYVAMRDFANAKYMLQLAEIILEKVDVTTDNRVKMQEYLKEQYKNIL